MWCEKSAGHLAHRLAEHSCSRSTYLLRTLSAIPQWRSSIQRILFFVFCSINGSEAWSQPNEQVFFGVALRSSAVEQRFARQRSEQEPVSTSLLNTSVTGMQSTVTETRLRFIPDPNLIRFELLNSGDVMSQTTGFNRQAIVESTGRHHFDLIKPMSFDGNVFLTLPCHGTIQASQTPNRVVSAAGVAMPLLSPLGDRVAWNEVMRRQPQINRAVAEDVSRDVLPKVDSLIDRDFERLGKEWRSLQRKINAAFRDTPLRWAGRTSDSVFALWTSPAKTTLSAAGNSLSHSTTQMSEGEEIVLFVSENALASLLRQFAPAGLKISDTELEKLQTTIAGIDEASLAPASLVNLLQEFRTGKSEEASLFTLEFSPEKPLEVLFVEGDIRIIATFQIHLKFGASSGWMTTSFNLRGRGVPDDRWTVAVRSVDVGESTTEPLELSDDRAAEPIAPLVIPQEMPNGDAAAENSADEAIVTTVEAGTAWMTIIRNAAESLAEKLPPVTLPLEFDGSAAIPGLPRLRLAKIESAGGMLRVSLRIADRQPVVSTRN